MIGQKDNLKRLNPLPLLTILYGLPGSGRWTLLSTIAKEQGYTPIKTNGDIDTIRGLVAITNTDNKNLYVIDNSDLTPQAANGLLKSTEEGIGNVRFAIKAIDRNAILPTLSSRSTIIDMQPYSDDEKVKLIEGLSLTKSDGELLRSLFATPGQVKALAEQPGGINYASSIVSFVANLANCDYGGVVSLLGTLDLKGNDIDLLPVGVWLLTFIQAFLAKQGDLKPTTAYRAWGVINNLWDAYVTNRVDMGRAITSAVLRLQELLYKYN